jgi:hypothetical protein
VKLVGKPEREYLTKLGIDEKINKNCTLKEQGLRVWNAFIWLRMGLGVRFF